MFRALALATVVAGVSLLGGCALSPFSFLTPTECMASDFYRTQVNRHLLIGMRSMEILRDQPPEKLHSRKLRSFAETAFQ